VEKLKIIFFTESAGGACSLFRAWVPCIGLNEAGHYARYSVKWQPNMKDEFDIFVFQRNSAREVIDLIYALKQEGKTVLYDVDDDLLRIPPSNPVFWVYLEAPSGPWYQIQSAVLAGGITTTTTELKNLYGVLNETRIIPNWINIEEHRDIRPLRVSDDKVLLFWGGSNTHKECLMLLEDVLPRVMNRYPEVGIVFMGDDPPFEVDWERVYQLPWGKYRFFKMVMAGCDIGLAPLAQSPFNLGKSDLRIKELAAARLPMVASNYGEYATSAPLAGGLVANTAEEWFKSLCQLVENEDERKARSEKAWEWAQQQDIRLNVGKSISVYREFLERAKPDRVVVGKDYTDAPLQFSYSEQRDREVMIASS